MSVFVIVPWCRDSSDLPMCYLSYPIDPLPICLLNVINTCYCAAAAAFFCRKGELHSHEIE